MSKRETPVRLGHINWHMQVCYCDQRCSYNAHSERDKGTSSDRKGQHDYGKAKRSK